MSLDLTVLNLKLRCKRTIVKEWKNERHRKKKLKWITFLEECMEDKDSI